MNNRPVAAEITAGDQRQNRLDSRVITMSTCPDQRSRFPRGRTETPTGTARRHWAEDSYAAVHPYSSTFLRPFAPDPLQALPRSYGRSDSYPRRFGSAGIIVRRPPLRLLREQVSLIHAPDLPTLPSPTTCGCFVSSRHVYLSTDRTEIASPRAFSQRELGASSFGSRLASSHRPNRVSYRTDWRFTSCCSPPRVTTTQLQLVTSYVDLERTFTPPTRCALRRTTAGVPPAGARASRPCAGMAIMAMAQRAGSGTLPRQRARRPHYKVLARMALL